MKIQPNPPKIIGEPNFNLLSDELKLKIALAHLKRLEAERQVSKQGA